MLVANEGSMGSEEGLTPDEKYNLTKLMKVYHHHQMPVTRDALQGHFNKERWPAFERSFDAIDKELELTDSPLHTSRTRSVESLLLLENSTHTGGKKVKFSYAITELQKTQPLDYETPRFTNNCKTMCWLNATMQVTPSLFSHTFLYMSINTLPAFPHRCCSILAHLSKR